MSNRDKWFSEKSVQTDCCKMVSFGIEIESRYCDAREMAEMLMFTKALAEAEAETLISRVFYDSKACMCSFIFTGTDWYDEGYESLTPQDRSTITACAKQTITQYQMFGIVDHGIACGCGCNSGVDRLVDAAQAKR